MLKLLCVRAMSVSLATAGPIAFTAMEKENALGWTTWATLSASSECRGTTGLLKVGLKESMGVTAVVSEHHRQPGVPLDLGHLIAP